MKTVMAHSFSEVPSVEIQRSKFNRSKGYKTTFDASYLVPILCEEIYPSDTVALNFQAFARLSTPVFPIMDNMYMDTFFFFVPHRLVFDNWKKLMGEQIDPGDSIDYTVPIINSDASGYDNQSVFDYFGLPTKVTTSYEHSALPLRGYNLIYNEWFRDQNLQDSKTVNRGNGPDAHTDYELLKRGKRHDYFTSCLPFLQKGDAVQLSLGQEAPITGFGTGSSFPHTSVGARETDGSGSETYANATNPRLETTYVEEDPNNSGYPNIRADLSSATASTVNELRQAIQIQRLLERDARAGTRYTEIVQSHFGCISPDSRLQRPELLGMSSVPVNIGAIPRTDSQPGELGAMATVTERGAGFIKSFTEHGYLFCIINVRADLTYQEGLEKHWSRSSRYDFYFPTLAHLGEQSVLNKEIYLDGSANDDAVFGYQERFAELRYGKSMVTGKFRSNDANTLDSHHLGIEFGSLPTLDDTFIQENVPLDRCIATPSEPHFEIDSFFNISHTRAMPTYSVPGLMDHF